MSSSNSSSLRPSWYKGSGAGGGKGFQPPPTIQDRGDKGRSASVGSAGDDRRDSNKFAALLEDDDVLPGIDDDIVESKPAPSNNSRSEAFRSSFNRSVSTGEKRSGRSLADLAAKVPESAPMGRRHSSTYEGGGKIGVGGGRFSSLRGSDASVPSGTIDSYKPDPKVIRYTREKLLSLRQALRGDDPGPPKELKSLEGTVVISPTSQDPVCWDTFDAEAIWETVRERRGSALVGAKAGVLEGDPRRRNAPSSGRWQRGVALPPPEEAARRKDREADNPDELWDDPVGGAVGAASDFSAFGALPCDGDDNAFDFDKMAEASRKLEEELHGSSKHGEEDSEQHHAKKVDVSRPLASAGTTLVSGSGDDVNVFEDFDSPSLSEADPSGSDGQPESGEQPAVRGGDEDPSASSRLMKMIGVSKGKDENSAKDASNNPWDMSPSLDAANSGTTVIDPIIGAIGGGISLNPWGNPVASAAGTKPSAPGGMDLGISLSAFGADPKSREAQSALEREKIAKQEAEMLRQRQQEEAQKRALVQQKAREQQVIQQQQAASQQSQIELVLMERICVILENSWGRSDLASILTTLHSEDSRVIPLLNNVDSLRALIARSPQRVAFRRDPNYGADMAVLLLTNAQWQQQQQQQQAQLQQEELRRRRMEEEAASRVEAQNRLVASINHDAPWFYSDPQNNIQGPFRGEEMRQWLEAGYFKGDLPISQVPRGPFHPLSVWFPDLNFAFRSNPALNGKEDAQALAEEKAKAAEQERLRLEAEAEKERQARKEAQRAAVHAAEKEAREKELAAQQQQQSKSKSNVESNGAQSGGNEPSTQLKMMLGLSSNAQASGVGAPEKEDLQAPKNSRNVEKKAFKAASKKATQKSLDESEGTNLAKSNPKTSTAPAPPAAPAWGGVTNTKPRKSMSEIQQEEARASAMLATKRGSMPQSSSGWANVAAGTSGWSSGTIRQSSGIQSATAAPGARPMQTRAKTQPAVAQGGASRKVAPITQQQRSSSTASSTPAEEFGTSMSPALEKFCKEKMQQINGSDDLTLVAFCMTLNDANEIRQYLTTYLGNSPQVNSFANDFINKRGLGSKQEEWETPGSAKKGRKKKAGR